MQSRHSKREVRRAGATITLPSASSEKRAEAESIVNYWRRIHEQPMRALMEEASAIIADEPTALLAGRIKKLGTIVDKMRRPQAPTDLDTLYDIAGGRIIVDDMIALDRVCHRLASSPFLDQARTQRHDYVTAPKPSGYRARHLIFRYADLPCGHTLSAELQVRTSLQHLWATAVEIYDAATGSRLKFNELDNAHGLFFKKMSRLIEQLERSKEPDTPSIRAMDEGFDGLNSALHVIDEIRAACQASTILGEEPEVSLDGYCLIDFCPGEQSLQLSQLDESAAFEAYFSKEARDSSAQHDYVLTKSSSMAGLKRLYPNYFGDVSEFVHLVDRYMPAFA